MTHPVHEFFHAISGFKDFTLTKAGDNHHINHINRTCIGDAAFTDNWKERTGSYK